MGIKLAEELDVLAVGNAIVDVIVSQDDAFLLQNAIPKGSMRLISADDATALYGRMGPGREISGGSAANTTAGIAALGGRAGFIGRVTDDQLGRVFQHDIRASGVEYLTAPMVGGVPTAQCLIVVTPDAQRTMSTYLGSCQNLDEADIDEERVKAAKITYLEGYLWDPAAPIRALKKAISAAHAANRLVAMTFSDVFCVEGHRDDFLELMRSGSLDLVFANENEAKALFRTEDIHQAVEALSALVPMAAITRSEHGAVVVKGAERHSVPVTPAARVLDTTGAGDLFAAGFLAGFTQGRGLSDSAVMGTIAAAEVIEHYGARPEADLKARVRAVLG